MTCNRQDLFGRGQRVVNGGEQGINIKRLAKVVGQAVFGLYVKPLCHFQRPDGHYDLGSAARVSV